MKQSRSRESPDTECPSSTFLATTASANSPPSPSSSSSPPAHSRSATRASTPTQAFASHTCAGSSSITDTPRASSAPTNRSSLRRLFASSLPPPPPSSTTCTRPSSSPAASGASSAWVSASWAARTSPAPRRRRAASRLQRRFFAKATSGWRTNTTVASRDKGVLGGAAAGDDVNAAATVAAAARAMGPTMSACSVVDHGSGCLTARSLPNSVGTGGKTKKISGGRLGLGGAASAALWRARATADMFWLDSRKTGTAFPENAAESFFLKSTFRTASPALLMHVAYAVRSPNAPKNAVITA
mmetsp:Transcript_14864/g.39848  ORF Transcript_14864/g.39848 Transcript_14864/m.39848 type:complete len:300 (-) Transcript_14864:82-981(-)